MTAATGHIYPNDSNRWYACHAVSTARIQAVESLWKGRGWFVWSAILLTLVVLMYGSVLKGLILQWWNDPDYSHGFFVPLFSGYVLWRQRERWLTTSVKPSNFGFIVMLGAVGLLVLGSLGAELFTSRFSLLLLLAGMILFVRVGFAPCRFFPVRFSHLDDSHPGNHL